MIQSLKNSELLERTQNLANEERRITQELIAHLREVERRMLFAEMGYSSLFEFCTQHLKLSEGSAGRRIAAMRLIRDVPEARQILESGDLSLSNAAKIQSAFQAQKRMGAPLLKAEKRELIAKVTGLTQRECEAKIFEDLPQIALTLESERQRTVGPVHTELKLVVDQAFMEKLQRLQELNSHRVPDGSWIKILDRVMTEEIERLEKKRGLSSEAAEKRSDDSRQWDRNATGDRDVQISDFNNQPARGSFASGLWIQKRGSVQGRLSSQGKSGSHKSGYQGRASFGEKIESPGRISSPGKKDCTEKDCTEKDKSIQKQTHSAAERIEKFQSGFSSRGTSSARGLTPFSPVIQKTRKKIPVPMVREVWRRAQGRCEMRNCLSRKFLETDHVIPVSQGGKNELGNLRLLCRAHNLTEAMKKLGPEKMARYVPALRIND